MKQPFQQLNKAFDNRIRLGIMSLLMINDHLDFNALKEALQLTDGNLATHISALEKEKYISITKQFVGKKPQTLYATTVAGRKAFESHLKVLEEIIKNSK